MGNNQDAAKIGDESYKKKPVNRISKRWRDGSKRERKDIVKGMRALGCDIPDGPQGEDEITYQFTGRPDRSPDSDKNQWAVYFIEFFLRWPVWIHGEVPPTAEEVDELARLFGMTDAQKRYLDNLWVQKQDQSPEEFSKPLALIYQLPPQLNTPPATSQPFSLPINDPIRESPPQLRPDNRPFKTHLANSWGKWRSWMILALLIILIGSISLVSLRREGGIIDEFVFGYKSVQGPELTEETMSNLSQVQSIPVHESVVDLAVLSNEGRVIYSRGDGEVFILDLRTERAVRIAASKRWMPLALNSDKTAIVTGNLEGWAYVWALDRYEQLASQNPSSVRIRSLAWGSHGIVAIGDIDGLVTQWDPANDSVIASLQYGVNTDDEVRGLAYSPDGKQLTVGGESGRALVWSIEDGERILMQDGPRIWTMAYSEDGQWIAAGRNDGTIIVWDAHTGDIVYELDTGNPVLTVKFFPNGLFLVAGLENGQLQVWSLRDGTLAKERPSSGLALRSLAISNDNSWIVAGSVCAEMDGPCPGEIYVWSAK